MSNYTEELAALYAAKKAKDIEDKLDEANKAAERREEQQKEWREEQEKKERDRQFEQKEREREEKEKLAQKEAELRDYKAKLEQNYNATIDKLSMEMEDLKILLSLPESERANYLKEKEEIIKQKRIEEEKRLKEEELKRKNEEEQSLIKEQEKQNKLDRLLNKLELEGIKPSRSQQGFFSFDTIQIAGENILVTQLNTEMSDVEYEQLLVRHREYINNKQVNLEHNKRLLEQRLAKNKRNVLLRRLRNLFGISLLVFAGYELIHKSYILAVITIILLVILYWSPIKDEELYKDIICKKG